LLNRLKPKSEFSKNVLTLMTGTTIAQAIPIAISPILTRIYTPEDFGVFALFISIVSIFGSIANGKYELAVMLPKKDEDAINIFALGFLINITLSLILLLIVIIFHNDIVELLNNKEISTWLYFIPISIFLIGCYNLLNYFNNRLKQYKDLAKSTIIKSVITAIIQIFFGFIKQGAMGLISGQIISQFFANTKLLKNIIKNKILLLKISKVKIIAVAKRYKDFLKYSVLASLTSILSSQLMNILISIYYNLNILGFYSLSQRLLGIPSSIIGNSIGQVFFKEAIIEKNNKGVTIKIFFTTIKKLTLISFLGFGILFFFVKDIFSIVFGKEWIIAGEYAQILIPFFAIRFIVSSISSLLIIWEKQKMTMYVDIVLLVLNIFLIIFIKNFKNYLITYSIVMSLNYLLFLIYFYNLSRGENK
jgi:O-antigen/teichoic acid export membrane protein